MLIDTHIHLSYHPFDQGFPYIAREKDAFVIRRGSREDVIREIRAAGTAACIDPAVDLGSNEKLLALAEQYPGFIFPAVGVHPTRVFQAAEKGKDGRISGRKRFAQFLEHPAVIAVGETGLDYHLARKEQHRLRQIIWFIRQLKAAHRKSLPVILHIREAHEDALRILRRYRNCLHGGVCHCFRGSADEARSYTELGLMLGIGGSLLKDTPGTPALEQAVIMTPLDRILLETDGPYVRPENPGFPNKQWEKARNTSLILPAVAARIAELKGIPSEEVERVTAENAVRVFRLPPFGEA